jgi:hypothetical protein
VLDLSDVVSAARFRSDMQGSQRILAGEWIALCRDAIRSTWNEAAQARPDFAFSSFDFTLVSAGSASVAVPRDFHSLIDVVFSPDTSNEYSLGPFAWQNRKSVGGWWPWGTIPGLISGGTRAQLKGNTIFIEPSLQAGGAYRMWYAPRSHTPDIIARLATTAALPACTAAGAGVGKTLTGNAIGVLPVDGQTVNLGDIILVQNQAAQADNGVYLCTTAGAVAVAFVLTRAVTFNATANVALGDIIGVGQTNPVLPPGALNEGNFYTVTTFTAIDGGAIAFTQGALLEPIIDQFSEVVTITMTIAALTRDGGMATTAVNDWVKQLRGPNGDGTGGLIASMRAYFCMTRSVGATKTIDTDQIGVGGWRGAW